MRWHSHTAFGKNVRGLLAELEATTSRAIKARSELPAAIGKELEIHTSIEDEIFYPAFRQAGKKEDDDKVFFDAMNGHRAAGNLVLPDLPVTDVNSAQFGRRAKVLKEMIKHHAGEEEKEIFPRTKEPLAADAADSLNAAACVKALSSAVRAQRSFGCAFAAAGGPGATGHRDAPTTPLVSP